MSDPEAVYVYANVQLDDPGLLEKLAGHDVQLDAPAALYVPAVHCRAAEEPAGQ